MTPKITTLVDTNIVAALIVAAATMFAAVFTVVFRWRADRDLKIVGASTRASVEGIWTGHIYQPEHPAGTPRRSEVEVQFRMKRKRVVGIMKCKYKSQLFEIKCNGGFYDFDVLILHYRNVERRVRQHGIFALKLASNGRSLTGNLAGYGHETESIVSGNVELVRAEQPRQKRAT